jgi:phytanoyl-CoA hydroxylase
MQINSRQLAQYRRDGFLGVDNFVSEQECDALRTRALELVSQFEPTTSKSIFSTHEQNRTTDDYFLESAGEIRFFFEENAFQKDGTLKQSKEESINKIGHALHDFDPVFRGFSRSESIKQLISDFGLEQPLLVQSMYIFKQPNIGGEVICHQDSTFLYTESNAIVGLWFALEDATVENGCLWAIPGGHRVGLKSRWVRDDEGGMKFDVFDSSPWAEDKLIPLEVNKGTLIILDGLLPHKSLPNRSAKSRHAYILHVINGSATYPADNWLQRPLAKPFTGF